MKYLIMALVIVLVLILSTFGVQNPTPVNVRFLGYQSGFVPLYAIMLVSAVIGGVITMLLGLPTAIQRRLELRRLRHQLSNTEQEVSTLKQSPSVVKPLSEDVIQRERTV